MLLESAKPWLVASYLEFEIGRRNVIWRFEAQVDLGGLPQVSIIDPILPGLFVHFNGVARRV